MGLENKIAIVTGAASGIGKESALLMARKGATIALADINGDGISSVARQIEDAGGNALAITADIASRSSAESMVHETLNAYGRVDVLVNSAGVFEDAETLATDDGLYERTMQANLYGTIVTNQAVAKPMIEQGGGRIINFASGAALRPVREHGAYAASKAGVIAWTKTLQLENAKNGIIAIVVSPGSTDTPMSRRWYPTDDAIAERSKSLMFKRFARPQEIAEVVAWAASDDTAHLLAGQTLHAQGGNFIAP